MCIYVYPLRYFFCSLMQFLNVSCVPLQLSREQLCQESYIKRGRKKQQQQKLATTYYSLAVISICRTVVDIIFQPLLQVLGYSEGHRNSEEVIFFQKNYWFHPLSKKIIPPCICHFTIRYSILKPCATRLLHIQNMTIVWQWKKF